MAAGYDTVTIATTPASSLTDFTHFVNLNALSADWWGNVRSDGNDVRASDENGNALQCNVLEWDYAGNAGYVGVKKTTGTGAGQEIRLEVGTEVSAPSTGVCFDSNWLFFSADGGETDSTSNGNNFTVDQGAIAAGGVTGAIDGSKATNYDGGDGLQLTGLGASWQASISMMCLFRRTGASGNQCPMGVFGAAGHYLRLNTTGGLAINLQADAGVSVRTSTISSAYTLSNWQWGAAHAETADRAVYTSDASSASDTFSRDPTLTEAHIGQRYDNTSEFVGDLTMLGFYDGNPGGDWFDYYKYVCDPNDASQSVIYTYGGWTASLLPRRSLSMGVGLGL